MTREEANMQWRYACALLDAARDVLRAARSGLDAAVAAEARSLADPARHYQLPTRAADVEDARAAVLRQEARVRQLVALAEAALKARDEAYGQPVTA